MNETTPLNIYNHGLKYGKPYYTDKSLITYPEGIKMFKGGFWVGLAMGITIGIGAVLVVISQIIP